MSISTRIHAARMVNAVGKSKLAKFIVRERCRRRSRGTLFNAMLDSDILEAVFSSAEVTMYYLTERLNHSRVSC